MSNALAIITEDIWSVQDSFGRVCADKSLNFEAEAGFALQSLMGNEYAMKVAQQNRQSVVNAVTNIAAIGISLNPAKKQAYLVPRDGRICLDISYLGLMDLAMQAGSIRWAQCALVYAGDEFQLNGLDKQPVHKFNPFAKDRGGLVGVYAVVKTCDGDYLTHPMSIEDAFAIRDKSSSWVAFTLKKTKSCVWKDHEGEMVKKTCIKQAYKYWPKGEKSDRLENAIHYMNEQAGEGLHKEPAQTDLRISTTAGAMEAMSREVQEYLRELASATESLFRESDSATAFDQIKAKNLDNEQTVALWTLLPSDMRAALKVEGQARRAATELLAA
jgi:recombination protein RecT